MKKILLLILFFNFQLSTFNLVCAQPSMPKAQGQNGGIGGGLMHDQGVQSGFMVSVNEMSPVTRRKIDATADRYRNRSRAVLNGGDIGLSMLSGGVAAVVDVFTTSIVNLIKMRSKEKQEWMQMRQKECTFVDSLSSVNGQSDFYGKQSNWGPLDPTSMNFDGITLRATRMGQDVLKMVCHIDTSRIDHIFLHSKFYLVVDTIQFYPYRSYLPNFSANQIHEPDKKDKETYDYWNTINKFSFDDSQNLNINIKMDISSSWINELVQVQKDVHLGSFTLNLSISKNQISKDGMYSYVRSEAMARNERTIDITGDCFVVPRSYMPVSAENPSWGTGEYRMKVTLRETTNYRQGSAREKDWHKDYVMMKRMRGQRGNDYVTNFITTFRDNASTILKATYNPAVTAVSSYVTSSFDEMKSTASSGGAQAGGAQAGGAQAGGGGAPAGQGGQIPQGGAPGVN